MFDSAKEVLKIFNDAGFEAYMVGGFVRDHLLGLESHDIDITTNALPEVVKTLFKNHFCQSEKFKTVTVRHNGFEFEVTTYRYDKSYSDHRHPKTVVASRLIEDVKRRDFTINSLCMDKDEKVIDFVGGISDLNNKVIRAVGNADKRFDEDALRMFRAFRFSTRLGFKIEDKTYRAIKKNSSLIKLLSKERVRSELEGILQSDHLAEGIIPMVKSDIFKDYGDTEKAFLMLENNYRKLDIVLFIALSSIIKGEISEEIMISKKERDRIKDIMRFAGLLRNRQLSTISFFEEDPKCAYDARLLLEILYEKPYKEEEIDEIYSSLPYKNHKQININGNDILPLLPVGSKDVGKYLPLAYLEVILGRCPNNREDILKRVKEEIEKDLAHQKRTMKKK